MNTWPGKGMDEKSRITSALPLDLSEPPEDVIANGGERFIPAMRGEIAFEHFHRYFLAGPLCAGRVVADIACGEGYGADILAQTAEKVFGFDRSEQVIERARQRYSKKNLSFIEADALCLPLPAKSCDIVVSFETIEHLADHDRALAEFRRVMKTRGILVISTPDKEVYNQERDTPNEFHTHEFYRDEFALLLKKFFKNVAVYGQQYFEGSVLFGGPNGRRRFGFRRHDKPSMLFAEQIGDPGVAPPAPTYMVAVASDGPLPELPLSLFASADHPQSFKERYVALNAELEERTQWLRRIQGELDATRGALQEQLTSVEGELTAERAQLEDLRSSRNQASEELSEVIAQRDALEELVAELRRTLADTGAAAEARAAEQEHRAKEAADELAQREAEWIAARAALEATVAELRRTLGGRDDELTEQRAQCEVLDKAVTELQGALAQSAETAEARVAEQQRRAEDAAQELARSRGELAAAHDELAASRLRREELEAQREALRRSLAETAESADARAAGLERRAEATAGELARRETELASARQQLTEALAGREALEQEVAALRLTAAQATEAAEVLAAEQGELQSKLDDTGAANAALQAACEGSRQSVRASVEQIQALHRDCRDTAPNLLTRALSSDELDAAGVAQAFDRSRYLARNADVAEAGVDPLLHYLTDGWRERRVHGALFDDDYYLAAYTDVKAAQVAPLYHYCKLGWREGRDPSALFDTNFYLETYPEAAASGLDPLTYFIRHGLSAGHRPNRVIDPVAILLEQDRDRDGFALAEKLLDRLASSALELPGISIPSSANPDVSIIIPVHNKFELTHSCLKSIERLPPAAKCEIILVDDVSRDLTPLVAPSWMGVRVIRNHSQQGFVGSCNRGAAHARGQYLFFLNNDTEVKPGWLDELVATFAMHGNVGIVGAKLIYPDGRLQEAGGIIWEDASGWNYGRNSDPKSPEYNYVRDVDYVSGAALMIPKDLFWSVGGFDRRYQPAYFEDTDLAFSVRKLGYRVLYQPFSCIVHHEGATAGTDVTTGLKAYQETNRPKFVEKWSSVLKRHLPNGCTPHIARERYRRYRMLMIDATTPTPDMDAGSLTQSYMIQLFQKLGFKVSFIPEDNFTHIGKYTEDLQQHGVEAIYHPYASSIEEHLREHGSHYDLIMAYKAPRVAKYIDVLRELAPQAKILVDTADLHFRRMMREAEVSGSAAKMQEALDTRALEFDVMRKADCTIILSTDEVEMLGRELPEAKLALLPLILETPGLQAPFEELKDICYVGGFRHNPNTDAVLYFHREIWPLVRQRLPGAKFRVIGSHPPEEICALAGKDVIVDGYVKDLGPTLGHCRLSVVPLRFGAGIKGKIGSSMSYGIPVVSTGMGTEGMGLTDNSDVLIADDPAVFADQVCRLYEDKLLWTKLSRNGLAFVRREYSLPASEARLAAILAGLGFSL
jgi:O-antigen biosynthesis protein